MASNLLASGMEPGARLALLLPNRPELVFAYLACFRVGIVAVPIYYRYRLPQIEYALEHSGSQRIIAHADRLDELERCAAWPELRTRTHIVAGNGGAGYPRFEELMGVTPIPGPLPQPRDEDLLLIIYTSGTTSRPKGVVHSQANMAGLVLAQQTALPLSPNDVVLPTSSVAHMAALSTLLLPTLHAGGMVEFLLDATIDGFFDSLSRHEPKTVLVLLPGMLHDVVHHPRARQHSWKSFRLCITGGDTTPVALHRAFREIYGLELTELCAMTELGKFTMNPPVSGRKKPGSIGPPFPGTRIRVVDEADQDCPIGATGEMLVWSPGKMAYYWNDPTATSEAVIDGWMRTGDLARYDEDGYLWFMGRKKHIIIRDDDNVSPVEVESAFREHDAVANVAVIGGPQTTQGQSIEAYVVLRPDALPPPSDSELRDFLKQRLPDFMLPDRILLVKELPRNAMGKIDRSKLVENH